MWPHRLKRRTMFILIFQMVFGLLEALAGPRDYCGGGAKSAGGTGSAFHPPGQAGTYG